MLVEGGSWNIYLPYALWAYLTAFKVSTHCTPFQLVYGTYALMPYEFILPTSHVQCRQNLWTTDVLHEHLQVLEQLDEMCGYARLG